jgi:hypothetical protein
VRQTPFRVCTVPHSCWLWRRLHSSSAIVCMVPVTRCGKRGAYGAAVCFLLLSPLGWATTCGPNRAVLYRTCVCVRVSVQLPQCWWRVCHCVPFFFSLSPCHSCLCGPCSCRCRTRVPPPIPPTLAMAVSLIAAWSRLAQTHQPEAPHESRTYHGRRYGPLALQSGLAPVRMCVWLTE